MTLYAYVQGKRASLTINLKNNGIMPASANVVLDAHPAFRLVSGGRITGLESKHSQQLVIEFAPEEVKQFTHEVCLNGESCFLLCVEVFK